MFKHLLFRSKDKVHPTSSQQERVTENGHHPDAHSAYDGSLTSYAFLHDSIQDIDTRDREENLRTAHHDALLRQHYAEDTIQKDKSTLEFEAEILREGSLASILAKTSSAHEKGDASKTKKQKGRSRKTKIVTFLAQAIAWWDLLMVILTFIHIERVNIALETVFRENYYDYCTDFEAYGSHIIWIQTIHGLACLVLLYSFSKAVADLMLVWLASKTMVLMYIGYRETHASTTRLHNKRLVAKTVGIFVSVLVFYFIEILIIIVLFFEYKKPYNQRRAQLQSNRPLNRDIYLRTLSPFMQRKYACRWAEKLQAIYVLQKIKERQEQREIKGADNEKNSITDEEYATRVAAGMREYKKSHGYNFGDLQDSASFTTRITHTGNKSLTTYSKLFGK